MANNLRRKIKPGFRYEKLLVLERYRKPNTCYSYWKCRCDCGNVTLAQSASLLNGHKKSCGCLKTSRCVGVGKQYGRLMVLEFVEQINKDKLWRCKCSCGNEKMVKGGLLHSGRTRSCGCMKRESCLINGALGTRNHTKWTPEEAIAKRIFKVLKTGAAMRGINVSLEFTDVVKLVIQPCFYCGNKPEPTRFQDRKQLVSVVGIDRVDSSLGYVVDNCVPCCKWCNYAKNVQTIDEFKVWVQTVYHHMFNPIPQSG